jgi:hypothetical protein
VQLYLSIVPSAGKWALLIAGGTVCVKHTQREAIKVARPLARKHRLELVIHNRRGQIRARDSQGFDSPYRKG